MLYINGVPAFDMKMSNGDRKSDNWSEETVSSIQKKLDITVGNV